MNFVQELKLRNMDLIVKDIVQLLSYEDFARCRKVSKEWRLIVEELVVPLMDFGQKMAWLVEFGSIQVAKVHDESLVYFINQACGADYLDYSDECFFFRSQDLNPLQTIVVDRHTFTERVKWKLFDRNHNYSFAGGGVREIGDFFVVQRKVMGPTKLTEICIFDKRDHLLKKTIREESWIYFHRKGKNSLCRALLNEEDESLVVEAFSPDTGDFVETENSPMAVPSVGHKTGSHIEFRLIPPDDEEPSNYLIVEVSNNKLHEERKHVLDSRTGELVWTCSQESGSMSLSCDLRGKYLADVRYDTYGTTTFHIVDLESRKVTPVTSKQTGMFLQPTPNDLELRYRFINRKSNHFEGLRREDCNQKIIVDLDEKKVFPKQKHGATDGPIFYLCPERCLSTNQYEAERRLNLVDPNLTKQANMADKSDATGSTSKDATNRGSTPVVIRPLMQDLLDKFAKIEGVHKKELEKGGFVWHFIMGCPIDRKVSSEPEIVLLVYSTKTKHAMRQRSKVSPRLAYIVTFEKAEESFEVQNESSSKSFRASRKCIQQ